MDREKKRGRAFLVGVKKDCKVVGDRIIQKWGEEVITMKIKREGDTKDLVIVSVYNNEEWSIGEETINRIVEKYKEEYIILGGDFYNARIGEEGRNEEDEWEFKRESKDKVINSMGRKFVNLMEELGGYILNSRKEGDRKGEYTYVSNKGCSVIDYVIVNEKGYDIINNFKIEDRVDSDHMPLVVEVEERMEEIE